jgi:hypothetical protein
MDKLFGWVRSFGNAGAVANARRLQDERRREDWMLRGLTLRIAGPEEVAVAV